MTRPLIIAHRGASGYRPEHTAEAKTLAHAMGADFLEQDLVATADDELLVLHDVHLDRVTNVADCYPERARADGRYYARDFTLAEIRELRAWERMNADGSPVYPGRYPPRTGDFRLLALDEELGLVARLNREAGCETGVYPELKRPAWHRAEGVDLAPLLCAKLRAAGYEGRAAPVFVQCFDPAELRRLREQLGYPWRLVQLIGINEWQEADADYAAMQTADGLREVAEYADAIGPWLPLLYDVRPGTGPEPTGLADAARAAGLAIHAYTVRDDDLPDGFASLGELVDFFTRRVGVDGFFTDFPDTLRELLDSA
ncbi:MAG: glycerophosphodiester phosphodiesterase [Woeseiaceae bacterium]|nr:glycerophosphodiester phosphodiesterase [Woeseiaceae bacterium]